MLAILSVPHHYRQAQSRLTLSANDILGSSKPLSDAAISKYIPSRHVQMQHAYFMKAVPWDI